MKLSVKTDDKFMILEFEDNGGGVEIAPVLDIFDINKSTKGSQGSGMGLALVKLLIEKRFKGTIAVSNTPNGVCFTIKIPKANNF